MSDYTGTGKGIQKHFPALGSGWVRNTPSGPEPTEWIGGVSDSKPSVDWSLRAGSVRSYDLDAAMYSRRRLLWPLLPHDSTPSRTSKARSRTSIVPPTAGRSLRTIRDNSLGICRDRWRLMQSGFGKPYSIFFSFF